MTERSRQTHELMQGLAEPALPAALWERVEAGRKLKMQRRKLGLGVVMLALLALFSAPLLAPMLGGMGGVAPIAPQVVHEPLRSEQDVDAELRALDHALQAAYDRGASDAEVAPMWEARNALLSHPPSRQDHAKTDQT